jgi:hypothetical protein
MDIVADMATVADTAAAIAAHTQVEHVAMPVADTAAEQ